MNVVIYYTDETAPAQARELVTGVSPSSLRAVGFDFNMSKDPRVDRIKALSAALISEMEILREEKPSAARLASIAITDIETAQMRAVKAATWK